MNMKNNNNSYTQLHDFEYDIAQRAADLAVKEFGVSRESLLLNPDALKIAIKRFWDVYFDTDVEV